MQIDLELEGSEAQAGAFSRPPDTWLMPRDLVPAADLRKCSQERHFKSPHGSSPGCVTPGTLLPQLSEPPPIQELPGRGLWSACTQEWIAGI